MRYGKSLIFVTVLALSALMLLWQSVLAGPPEKPGNQGLPGCLAEVAAKDAEIDVLKSQALVPQTGQTKCWDTDGDEIPNCAGTGQDGELQKGVECPEPRFTVNGNGTVSDNCTGLMWVKNGAILPEWQYDWYEALEFCNDLNLAGHDDWRMPNVKEMLSLIDYENFGPALPAGHPFENIFNHRYWTSTTDNEQPIHAFAVYIRYGLVWQNGKTDNALLVLPVRGGN